MKSTQKKYHYASFNYINEIKLPIDVVRLCSHSGNCDDDVIRCMELPYVKKQLAKIDSQKLIKELSEYGAWNENELSNHNANLMRILWIAAGNISEEI